MRWRLVHLLRWGPVNCSNAFAMKITRCTKLTFPVWMLSDSLANERNKKRQINFKRIINNMYYRNTFTWIENVPGLRPTTKQPTPQTNCAPWPRQPFTAEQLSMPQVFPTKCEQITINEMRREDHIEIRKIYIWKWILVKAPLRACICGWWNSP